MSRGTKLSWAIFAQRLEKVKLAGSAALGGVGHPRFTVSAGRPDGPLVPWSPNKDATLTDGVLSF
ncbi:hypothetical protein [Edaphobacter aggregans]|uniref:hypothetical protein n=1 Tax=Edaphobacter aggregans TaxID=570835 RepID=UPI0012F8A488|nr:hypothetical protein [Edaphobacter aggregans]